MLPIERTHLLTLITLHSDQEQIRCSIREINRDIYLPYLPDGLSPLPCHPFLFWINCLPTNTVFPQK